MEQIKHAPACHPTPPCSTLGLYGTCRVWALGGAGGEPALNEAEKQDGLSSFLDAAAAAVELSESDPNLSAKQREAVAQVCGQLADPSIDAFWQRAPASQLELPAPALHQLAGLSLALNACMGCRLASGLTPTGAAGCPHRRPSPCQADGTRLSACL